MEYLIRHVKVSDAQAVLDFVSQVAGESDNLTFGEGEFNMPLEKEVEFLKALEDDDNAIMLLAFDGEKVIGNLSYSGGKRVRTRHTGEFGVSVRKDYWGQGIGSALIKTMIDWAKSSDYCEKINLKVREDNFKAISLYMKLGFRVEGVVKKDMKINGAYVNAIFMGLDIK